MSKILRTLTNNGAFLGLAAIAILSAYVPALHAGEAASPPEVPAAEPGLSAPPSGGGTEAPKQQEPGPEGERKLTLLKIFEMGGPLMYVLFALSISLIAMITYFFLAFNPGNIMPPAFLKRIQQIIRDKKMDEARMYCAQNRNVVSHIIRSGLDAVQKGPSGVLEAMNGEGSRRSSSFWQKINFLSDIAVIAPMVGLLGTVIGMFHAFMSVSSSGITAGKINPAYLTSGVAQAVITTIAGLIIGILATMAYAYFRGVVQRIVTNLEAVCSRYSDMIGEGAE
jgi:biopolymer transport protein ExbB